MFNINAKVSYQSECSWYPCTQARKETPLFNVYRCMLGRCKYPTYKSWHRYGGRGIKVCDEWLESFQPFAKWAMANGFEPGLQLDRIDNDGNYEPNNCRFVTSLENNRNRSITTYPNAGKHLKKSVVCLETGEIFASAQEASKYLGLNPSAVSHRIKRNQKCLGFTFKYKSHELSSTTLC
jgi:hypothetical protein